MKRNPYFRSMILLLSMLLASMACNLPGSAPSAPAEQYQEPAATSAPVSQDQPELTEAPPQPEVPTEAPQSPASPAEQATCTTLANLYFRSGPDENYPDIDGFTPNSTLIPLGYNADSGFGWIYAQNPANSAYGWVGDNSNYLTCNIDPATLPYKAADAPPPAAAGPAAQNSRASALPTSALGAPTEGGGTCGPGYPYDCYVNLSDDAFIQFVLLKDGKELTAEDGVLQVDFRVMDYGGNQTIYEHTEQNAPYCIFGGNNGCASWAQENGVYTWGNGKPVKPDTYLVQIDPTLASGDNVHWEWYVEVSLQ